MTAAVDVGLAVATGVFPGVEPRLLVGSRREELHDYLAQGGYAPLRSPEVLLDEIEAAHLRGRGGAAFPLARKVRAVRAGAAAPVLVANGEEGEPASVKDRWLMRNRPHLVLDGVRLAAAVVGAQDVFLYVSDAASAASLEAALVDVPAEGWNEISVRVHQVDPAYVAGEETAAVRSINGGPALPQDKPPRPFEAGVAGRPTMVSNVETLANLPVLLRLGAPAYRDVGTEDSPGTFLMTLGGTVRDGLYEVPFGATLGEVLEWLEVDAGGVHGALVGGYFAGVLDERVLDLPLEYGAFLAVGGGLGCGAVGVMDAATCPVTVSASLMDYFARVNAGQCGSCFNGTAAMAAVLAALRDHRAQPADLHRLERWSTDLRGRGACGTLDGATNVAASLMREYPTLVAAHLASACTLCAAAGAPTDPPYAVNAG